MEKEELIIIIKSAFSNEEYPGDMNIVYDNSGKHLECTEIREIFKGKTWQSLPGNFIFEQRFSLPFFSKEGFKYYLPAFMIYAIKDFYGSDTLPDSIISNLTLPIEIDVVIMANAIKKYKIDAQMSDLDFNEILQNQLRVKNAEVKNFIEKAILFSKDQANSILLFLEYMKANYKDEFLNSEPGIAIDRYWFQFK